MTSPRPDLNGARLKVRGETDCWLVFHGQRHFVSNLNVKTALFSPERPFTDVDTVDDILRGFDLVEGSCLVQPENAADVYLVTGFPATDVRRYHIGSYETFVAFGFSAAAVGSAPALVVAAIPAGRPLVSAEAQ